jgi:hypothetical protein
MELPSVVHHLPPIRTSADDRHVGLDYLIANLRAVEAARVLKDALHAAGLGRVAAQMASGRGAPTIRMLPIEPTDARGLAAFVGRLLGVFVGGAHRGSDAGSAGMSAPEPVIF